MAAPRPACRPACGASRDAGRAVKHAVGVTAWAILEDIALDASVDSAGRLVAETNVRRIADNLGLSKNTDAKHLGRLREHGLVLHEEQRDDGTGGHETSRYVLDPSACVERFTVTPTERETSRAEDSTEPRPKKYDTGPQSSRVGGRRGHWQLGRLGGGGRTTEAACRPSSPSGRGGPPTPR